jgi:peptidoglycan/LPS O-acetylase OafA/YrhL
MKSPLQTAEPNQQTYRPDIDGLRAVAVLSVILFHINKALVPGGFVGVDIFFVISGYLISLHIFRDLERGRFSLVEFYRRRIKRIAPAMLVVVAVTLTMTQLVFRPEDAEASAESALWSLFSLANVFFWLSQDTNYFAAATTEIPLLHLWSLGVEEQFYIFWPFILMLIYRATPARLFFSALTLISALSFLLGEQLFDHDPSFVYYMLPTRAGELLVGALAAHVVVRRRTQAISVGIATLTGVSGMLLIAGSFILLSEEQVFPGLLAVPPTIGTAMLILAGHYGNSWPTRLLKLRPMTWVGLISYSAYLWHWPLLAFFHYGQSNVGPLAGSVIFALTILLAWLSYLYVERPARLSKRAAIQIFARQYVIPAGALTFVALVAMKIDGYGLRWISEDYKANLATVRDSTRPAVGYDYVCQRQKIKAEDLVNDHCVVGAEIGGPPVAILWGDSNAAHYIGMIAVFAREQGFRFRNVEIGLCPPIEADPADFVTAKTLADCRDSIKTVRQSIDAYPVVLISAAWSLYQSRSDRFLDVFFDTARALASRGKLVVILGKVPVISTYDRLCWEKTLSFPFMKCWTPSVPLAQDVASINARIKEFADSAPNVEYFDVTNYLCPNGECSAFDKSGKRIYYDSSHLTLAASWELGNDIYQRDGVPTPFTLISAWPRTAMVMEQQRTPIGNNSD